jgi:hypothetical protein
MKQITNKTILKQGDKTYQPIEVDGVIYWVDKISQIIVGDWYSEMVMGKVLFTHKMKEEPLIGWNESEHTKNSFKARCSKIVAQSQTKLPDIPIVSLDSYSYMIAQSWEETFNSAFYDSKINVGNIAKDCVLFGFNSNPNQYTQADIERALSLAFLASQDGYDITTKEILEQINSISVIEVDEDFNVLSYE